jgi:hypothetical protein
MACSTYVKEERCIQSFGGETWGNETTWKTRRSWEDNIKMNLREVGWEIWTGLIWLWTGTDGGFL